MTAASLENEQECSFGALDEQDTAGLPPPVGIEALCDDKCGPRPAACPPRPAVLEEVLAAALSAPGVALLEEDTPVRSVAGLLEVVASEHREALPFLFVLLEQSAAMFAFHQVSAIFNTTPRTAEAVLRKAADDLNELERIYLGAPAWKYLAAIDGLKEGEVLEKMMIRPNVEAIVAVARMRAARLEAGCGRELAECVGDGIELRRRRLEAIVEILTASRV